MFSDMSATARLRLDEVSRLFPEVGPAQHVLKLAAWKTPAVWIACAVETYLGSGHHNLGHDVLPRNDVGGKLCTMIHHEFIMIFFFLMMNHDNPPTIVLRHDESIYHQNCRG